jgi:hypothetical protein
VGPVLHGYLDVVLVRTFQVASNKVGKCVHMFCAIAIPMTTNRRFVEVLVTGNTPPYILKLLCAKHFPL